MAHVRTFTFAVLGVLAAGGGASAQSVQPEVGPSPFADAQPLAPSELGKMSGGQQISVTVGSSQTLDAVNSGNSVTGQTVSSGNVAFGKGALQDYSGIGNFVINTGHNNNLQGSISVNIATAPAR